MRYEAILFDLDGTLVESVGLYQEALITAFFAFGVPMTPAEYFQWYTSGKHLHDMMAHYKIDPDKEPSLRKLRDETYIELLSTKTNWLPNAEVLLERTKGVPRGIITGSWRAYVDAIDTRLKVTTYIPTIITADEIHTCMKPKPDGLLMAAKLLNVDPTKCVYIGDQSFDVEAAANAGMESIFIRSHYSPDTLTLNPNYIVTDLIEIESILELS